MIRLIIAGGREFADYEAAEKIINSIVNDRKILEVVSGSCPVGTPTHYEADRVVHGADGIGEQWAAKRGIHVRVFPADFKRLGRSAGPKRNKEMAEYGDELIAFYDGHSKGTGDMINKAHAEKITITIVYYTKDFKKQKYVNGKMVYSDFTD